MAIEFNCPYCTAAIRVPDEFSGKRGSCPKCATKLLVPDVVPQAAETPAPLAPAATIPENSVPVVTGGSEAIPPLVTPAATPSVARSLQKKRRRGKSQQLVGLLIPALCFFAFMGALGLIFFLRTPELKGTLTGNAAVNMHVPKATVSIADLGLTEQEQEQVRLAFRDRPESYLSEQMTCRVELSGTSLAIDIEAGKGFSWYTVNPTTDVVLANWIRQNTKSLDAMRLKRATAAGSDLCRDKVARGEGTTAHIEAAHFRDDFGLGFHVQAFGFAVEAVAGKRRSLCAHEDNNGTLYFVLPNGVSEFTLRGRNFDGGASVFPGEYRVLVPGGTDVTPEPPVAPVEAEPETDTDQETMSDEPMSAPTDKG